MSTYHDVYAVVTTKTNALIRIKLSVEQHSKFITKFLLWKKKGEYISHSVEKKGKTKVLMTEWLEQINIYFTIISSYYFIVLSEEIHSLLKTVTHQGICCWTKNMKHLYFSLPKTYVHWPLYT